MNEPEPEPIKEGELTRKVRAQAAQTRVTRKGCKVIYIRIGIGDA